MPLAEQYATVGTAVFSWLPCLQDQDNEVFQIAWISTTASERLKRHVNKAEVMLGKSIWSLSDGARLHNGCCGASLIE